jgi:hypothetical protein
MRMARILEHMNRIEMREAQPMFTKWKRDLKRMDAINKLLREALRMQGSQS